MTELEKDHYKRSRIAVVLLWVCLGLGIAASFATGNSSTVTALFVTGLPTTLLCSFLVRSKKGLNKVKYVVSFGFSIISFFFLLASDDITNILIIYLGLGITTLFSNYRPVVLYGIFSIISINYVLFANPHFVTEDPIGINAFLVLCIAVLVMQSRLGDGMMQKIEDGRKESEIARLKTEKI